MRAVMTGTELAALLCSRVCHDLISPVGAMVNGIEVMDEDDDPDMREHAMQLLRSSARQASAKLQFARLAFGAGASAGDALDLADAKDVAGQFFANEKLTLEWHLPAAPLDRQAVRLLLNLLLAGAGCLPRGGRLSASMEEGETLRFIIAAEGERCRLPAGLEERLAAHMPEEGLDARSVQGYYAGLIAHERCAKITVEQQEGRVTLLAAMPAGLRNG
jgi:histidine phosphotransferase ChpT